MRPLFFLLLISLSVLAQAKPTAFLFFGDTGTGGKDQLEVAKGMRSYCSKEQCDFVALLGDNFYPIGVKSVDDSQWKTKFHDVYNDLKLDFFVALGNHDYLGNVDAQVAYTAHSPIWNLPSRYYMHTRDIVDFFVIDTNNFNETQMTWLKAQLKSSQATWKIVYGHHPIYSYGEHGNNSKLIKYLVPILKNNVDFYLCGHDHDKQVLAHDGFISIVSGATAQLRPTKKGELTLYSASKLGFSHFSIEKNQAHLRVLDKNGEVEFEKTFIKGTLSR